MEFEDQEEREEEMGLPGPESYDPLENSTRVKMPSSGVIGEAQTGRNNNNKGRYRECLKNHAAGIGGHALDGCGEFMAAGVEGTLDGLKCAACNCHRNFHRKETETVGGGGLGVRDPYLLTHQQYQTHHHHQQQFTAYYRTPAGYLHMGGQQSGAPLALPSTSGGGGGGTQSTREDQEDVSNPLSGGSGGSKKRFRTKFTQEQKEKMLGLAERLGWRIQKHDEAVVQQFCDEMGIKRHVLKVWMHNNKHTLARKDGNLLLSSSSS